MRLLAADVGNTNLTIGLFDDGRLAGSWRAGTNPTATPDELAAQLAGLLALDGHALTDVDAAAIASVVPPLTANLARALEARAGVQAATVEAASLSGVLPIHIDRPAEAGADRLCNALAARVEFGGPAIVVDLGTSTNFDVLSADGAYLGGAIAPGLGLSLEALVGRASKLPRIELGRPPAAIGANTVHAMQSGTVLGYIGLVSGLLTALRGELVERSPAGSRVTVIATGGYTAEPWLSEVPGIDHVEPDLTLRGIHYAFEAIRGAALPAARQEARS
ncbi:MAG TPA: type III pantothenate kinase [candidate division Zixibacteria bacterium]|nr:type III pantothenate kinase [candidate division Zixibacteria bacterium]